jgi:hypothetical protein
LIPSSSSIVALCSGVLFFESKGTMHQATKFDLSNFDPRKTPDTAGS